MLKLFLRFYLLMLLLVVIVSIYSNQALVGNAFTRDHLVNGVVETEVHPVFQYLQQRLQVAKPADWPGIIKNLTPPPPYNPLNIEPINQIKLNAAQMKRLNQGEIVGNIAIFHEPIENGMNDYSDIAYQRIGMSNQALVYVVDTGQDSSYLSQQAWLIHFISLGLTASPEQEWPRVLQKFSQEYNVPVQLIPFSQLTPELQTYMLTHHYVYDLISNLSILHHFYYLYSPSQVLVIGPYPGPWYATQFGPLFLWGFMLFVGLCMFFSLYSFYRDLRKLDHLAQAYGEGNFNYPLKVNRFAAMGQLYRNLKIMGFRIQTLLASHKELTQAVSHELKTPLTRLKFALTMIEEAKTPEESQLNLKQAQDAVIDLEELVGELLIYTRFDRELFDIEKEKISISQVLPSLLQEQQTKHPEKKLSWQIPSDVEALTINIAPQYFKKLIENLLSNAFRYAKSEIQVKLHHDEKQVYIEVHDDGPGIPVPDRQKIFEPFVSLDESRNKELSGHGLGLAIVDRIVNAHQGKVWVEDSEALKGAGFVLAFPISA